MACVFFSSCQSRTDIPYLFRAILPLPKPEHYVYVCDCFFVALSSIWLTVSELLFCLLLLFCLCFLLPSLLGPKTIDVMLKKNAIKKTFPFTFPSTFLPVSAICVLLFLLQLIFFLAERIFLVWFFVCEHRVR